MLFTVLVYLVLIWLCFNLCWLADFCFVSFCGFVALACLIVVVAYPV